MEINGELLTTQLLTIAESLGKPGQSADFVVAIKNSTANKSIVGAAVALLEQDMTSPTVHPLLNVIAHLLFGIHVGIQYQKALQGNQELEKLVM